jgi:predicted 2-oxoglutarate/Fe(II)-dependent dioxygenase YbiX
MAVGLIFGSEDGVEMFFQIREVFFHADMMQQRTIINLVTYFVTQTCLQTAIKRKHPRLLWKGVLLVHDNAWLHSATTSQRFFFAALPWEIMHPVLKEHHGGHRFQSDENVETTVKR